MRSATEFLKLAPSKLASAATTLVNCAFSKFTLEKSPLFIKAPDTSLSAALVPARLHSLRS
eukprot:CAMPEP_0181453374 /NCGR_PEP_ID=MMETSP1110-20121109/29692_1 /TAXON_ID=174948 /ORGANISM="Symbiodinium sp., Strain CCMP421" /LENGTH=60 /DNA_ID=CAMNT_0023577691 /DNA_START=252 /DNA_END=434 /DNA_ORIENTATION=-